MDSIFCGRIDDHTFGEINYDPKDHSFNFQSRLDCSEDWTTVPSSDPTYRRIFDEFALANFPCTSRTIVAFTTILLDPKENSSLYVKQHFRVVVEPGRVYLEVCNSQSRPGRIWTEADGNDALNAMYALCLRKAARQYWKIQMNYLPED
jgi:hypothetical protein